VSLGHYRRFSGRARARDVLRDLLERPCRFLLVRDAAGGTQRAFQIDTRLLRRLARAAGGTLASALPPERAPVFGFQTGTGTGGFGSIPGTGGGLAPMVSQDGTAVAVPLDTAPVRHALYPELSATPKRAVPGRITVVTVSLSDQLYAIQGTRIEVAFPSGIRETTLTAAVTDARGFVPPEGQPWATNLLVRLDAQGRLVLPDPWTFTARAIPSETYELTVTFSSGAANVGSVTIMVGDEDTNDVDPCVSTVPVDIRPPRLGRTMVLLLCGQELHYRLFVDGRAPGIAGRWPEDWSPDHLLALCNALESAQDLDAVRVQGKILWGQLPGALQDWLLETRGSGVPLTIVSYTPLFPFEAAVLAGGGGETFLGVDRPVVRWVPETRESPLDRLDVTRAISIRPVHQEPPTDPQTAAIAAAASLEDATLERRLGPHARVRTAAALLELLAKGDASLVHYHGGHAQGSPEAGLVMDGGLFTPAEIVGKPLFERGRPFVFINACQAALANPGELTVKTNFPRTLIDQSATGVVASLLRLDAAVAPKAAEVFYDAVGRGLTVGEALRLTREQALHVADPAHARSFMSYLAWASPDLHLDLHPKAAAATSSAVG
jgi:hypothetical protein